jgi:hypothetical protein
MSEFNNIRFTRSLKKTHELSMNKDNVEYKDIIESKDNEIYQLKKQLKKVHNGWIYCISNPSMPGLYKIGITERTPIIRLEEANKTDTWRPPTPYVLEFAKPVINPKHKEKTIHNILSKFGERVNPNREFFRVNLEDIQMLFDLFDDEEIN